MSTVYPLDGAVVLYKQQRGPVLLWLKTSSTGLLQRELRICTVLFSLANLSQILHVVIRLLPSIPETR